MNATNLYATDGRCHNSEAGWYNQECGKPATWLGSDRNGFTSGYCDDCKEHGREGRAVVLWARIEKGVTPSRTPRRPKLMTADEIAHQGDNDDRSRPEQALLLLH